MPRGVYWYGSRLTIEETRRLAPYNNATSLQVTAAVLGGLVWAIENPQSGIVEADQLDHERVLDVARPYLGELGRRIQRLDAAAWTGERCSPRIWIGVTRGSSRTFASCDRWTPQTLTARHRDWAPVSRLIAEGSRLSIPCRKVILLTLKTTVVSTRAIKAIGSRGNNMSDLMMDRAVEGIPSPRPHLDEKPHVAGAVAFLLVLAAGLGYAAFSISSDIGHAGESNLAIGAFVLLAIALLIALGFEFVNGFHDTANAVATVIYTHSLPPLVAVIWSGAFNFLGVLTSSGAVAFTIVTLLPVELILQVGSGAGYAMIFALLIAAIIWNLGTWAMGLPNSSSHALVGSIMGVGLANQLLAPSGVGDLGRGLGAGGGRVQGAAVQPGDRVRARRACCCWR